MIVNRSNLDAIFKNYDLRYQGGMENSAPLMELARKFAMEVPSTGASNFYAWMDKIAQFREWFGPRVFRPDVVRNYEIANREFEWSDRVKRNDVEDDQLNVLGPRAAMAGEAWIQKKFDLAINVILDNPNDFTGSAWIANTHSGDFYSGTLDNLVTSSLSAAAFQAAFATAAGWKFRDGILCRTRWTHLIVGETLRTIAWNIVKNRTVASGSAQIDNPDMGRVELIVDPALNATAGEAADVDAEHFWYLWDGSMSIKPVALQIRKEAAPLMDTDPAHIERTGFVDILASGRAAAGPTFPHMIYGGQATS